MKSALPLFLLLSSICWAQSSSSAYTVNVHVTSSEWVVIPSSIGQMPVQKLKVLIDGKKYELEGVPKGRIAVVVLGDYKAKLVEDLHKNNYEISQTYELQFPDGKTRKFDVVGLLE